MAFEWYITILSDPQGFWKLLGHFLAAPFTGNSTDTAIFLEFLNTLLSNPLWLGLIVPFVLLLGSSLFASSVAIASGTRKEKKEQMERHLAKNERNRDEKCSLGFFAFEERVEIDKE